MSEFQDEDGIFGTFLKGTSMGCADIVPGVSGGTIALILGIYERLIFAIKTIDFKFIPYFFLSSIDREYWGKARKNFSSIDFRFLIPLAAGMGLAFLVFSQIIPYFLDHFPAYIYSFFFGLILVSAGIVYGRIDRKNITTFVFGVFGFLFAFFFVGLPFFEIGHSLPIIFVSGFFAICAMILPGISGSFIVLFLNQYHYMLDVLKSLNVYWKDALVFMLGAVISLVSFSRLLSYLLKRYRSKILFFLSGLMIGALRLPFEEVVGTAGFLQEINVTLGVILAGLIGAGILVLLEREKLEIES